MTGRAKVGFVVGTDKKQIGLRCGGGDCDLTSASLPRSAEDGQFVRGLRNEQVRMRREGGNNEGGKDTTGDRSVVMFWLAMKMRPS